MLFLVLFLIVVVSECTGGGNNSWGGGIVGSKSYNGGVVVNSFRILPDKVFKNEKFDIMLELENVGASNANGKVYIFGPLWLETIEEEFTLQGADPLNGIPGGRKTIVKTGITADANIPPRTAQDYYVRARICYTYETTYLATITSTSKNEFIITNKGVEQTSSQQLGGPISIKIEALPTYANDKLTVVFKLANVGGGFPAKGGCTLSPSFNDMYVVSEFKVTSDAGTVKCEGNGNTVHDISLSHSNTEGYVRCEISDIPTNVPNVQITLQAVARYTYYSTRITTLTVIGGS